VASHAMHLNHHASQSCAIVTNACKHASHTGTHISHVESCVSYANYYVPQTGSFSTNEYKHASQRASNATHVNYNVHYSFTNTTANDQFPTTSMRNNLIIRGHRHLILSAAKLGNDRHGSRAMILRQIS